MEAASRTSSRATVLVPVVCLHLAGVGDILAILCGILMVCGPWSDPGIAQERMVLGQSPVGPLLDDGEAGTWLDQAPATVSAGGYAFGGTAAEASVSSGGSSVVPTTGFYREDVVSGGIDGGVGMGFGQAGQCPDCGGIVTAACPTCFPTMGEGEGFPAGGVMGIGRLGGGGLIAECYELLEPMTQESWLYRPFSAGWFMGFMQGNELVEDWVGQEQGFFGGYRFGWDIDPSWGWETRFGFASVALYDSDRAKAAQEADDLAAGLTPSDPYYHRFDTRRDSGVRVWDVDVLWYPFGDTYLRPYLLLGLGTGRVDFTDRFSERRVKSVLEVPIALGFKYRLREWLAVRVEATDNFIAGAGSGFKNLHNLSLTAGLELRFGGTRTGYWPYYPGRHYW